jgi:spore coat polysaccharide biosynthesis protein SpsF (cytidylyltransferase family)
VVVILPNEKQAQEVEGLVPPDVLVFTSDEPDELARVHECLETFMSEAMVRVRLDSPLVDPCLIDRLVTAAERDPAVDYATFCSGSGHPAIQSPLGLFAEFCSTSAVRRVNRAAKTTRERRDFNRYILRRPNQFKVELLPIPQPLDRDDLRLSLRHQEDWEHAEQIVDALGADGLEWPRIARLLEQQPELRERMAVLNRAEL